MSWVQVRLLAMSRGELSAVITRLMSKCSKNDPSLPLQSCDLLIFVKEKQDRKKSIFALVFEYCKLTQEWSQHLHLAIVYQNLLPELIALHKLPLVSSKGFSGQIF